MTRRGIWTSPTDFVSFSEKNLTVDRLSTEMATRQRRGDFFAFTQYMPNPDPVLKKQGKDITAYREILSDAHLGGCIDTRKANVLALEHTIDRGKAKSRQAKAAEENFRELDIDRITSEYMDCIFFGHQPMEILYSIRPSRVWIDDILGKPQEWFFAGRDNEWYFRSIDHPIDGELVHPDKIIVATHQATYDNPYGFPVLSRAFWPAFFKKVGYKNWVTFGEKYGMPWVNAQYPDGWIGNQDRIDNFFDDVEAMVQDALLVLPKAANVQVTPTGGSASVEIYKTFTETMNADMSKAVFGHGAAADSTPGRLGNEETAINSADAKKASDRKLVQSFYNRVLATWTRLNFGEGAVAPQFILFEEQDVDQVLADRDTKLFSIGWRPTPKYIERAYFMDAEEFTLEHVKPAPAGGAQFAEGDAIVGADQVAIDERVEQSADVLRDAAKKLRAPILAAVKKMSSYEDALDSLDALYPGIKSDAFTEQLAHDLFNAAMAGALAIDNEEADE